ncbi:MAG: hypothetical protein J0L52_11940 [Caulobacterales bacterium]|nr:hypothetical protein [Caulobacterales bacterium]
MFVGPLDSSSVEVIRTELGVNDQLIIKSSGGERYAASQLARVLVERNSTLIINSDCFSACALYLALSATRTEIPLGATLLFHNDTAMWIEALEQRPDLFSDFERQTIFQAHQDLESLLLERGINPLILSCMSAAIDPQFELARRARPWERQAGSDIGVIIPTTFDWVWMSRDVLEQFGAVNIEMSWGLDRSARETYSELRGMSIAWIDSLAQC